MVKQIIVSVNSAMECIYKLPLALKKFIVFVKKSDNIRIIGELRRHRAEGREITWHWKMHVIPQALKLEREVNPHIAILGESGSGKSNACMALLKHLTGRGANFAVLDTADEYIGISKLLGAKVYNCAHSGINIFELDGMSHREKASDLVTMLTRHFKLGQYQASVLNRCLRYMYDNNSMWPALSMASLMSVIAIFRKNADARESAALQTLRDRFNMIYSSSVSDSIDFCTVLSGNSVFAMSGLHTNESQAIFMEGFLRKLYTTMLESRKTPKNTFYVVIEEAQKIGESEILGRIVSEGRKYGIGIIAIAQGSKRLERDVRVNSSVFMSLYQREPEELNYISNFIAGGNEGHRFIEVKKALRSLKKHHAVVLSHGLREPVIVKFPIADRGNDNAEYRISEYARNGISRGALLRKLYAHKIYYNESSSAIDCMVHEGRLGSHLVENCGDFDGTWYISNHRNSARHDILVALISKRLTEKGVSNKIYNGPNGPDIIARVNGENVAYEYETGSKSRAEVITTLSRRKETYRTIIVVASPQAANKYVQSEGVRLLTESEFFS